MDRRTWTDQQLRDAVASQRSWRGVLRALGLKGTSSNSIGVVQRHAERMDLDTSHFSGQRRWSDIDLRDAVSDSQSWPEVSERLGLIRERRTGLRLKGEAIRLGLDVAHLDEQAPLRPPVDHISQAPQLSELRHAAPSLAAAWFAIRGLPVALPSEPQEYDLLVATPDGIQRVQVKSTTSVARNGSWQVGIGRRPYSLEGSGGRIPYDPDRLDLFVVINGDGDLYVIPITAVAGLVGIYLDSYADYRVGSVASLLN